MALNTTPQPPTTLTNDTTSPFDILSAVFGGAAVIVAILALLIAFLQMRKHRAKRFQYQEVFELDA
jgi:hypothetical protein